MAAAQLAMDHFNDRDTAVVPDLARLRKCDVYFPKPLFQDSAMDASVSMRAMLGVTAAAATQSGGSPHMALEQLPCAVLGPTTDEAALQVNALTDSLNIPQVIYHGESDLLLSEHYPNTIGMVLSSRARARAMVEFLQQEELRRDYLAVITQDSPAALDLTNLLKETGDEYELEVTAFEYRRSQSLTSESSKEEIRQILKGIKGTGIRTIFVNVASLVEIIEFAQVMEQEQMFANEYLYILSPSAVRLDQLSNILEKEEDGSPLHLLLSGSLIFDALDGFRSSNKGNDPFLLAWRNQDSTFVDRLNAMQPLQPDESGYFEATADYFSTHDPVNYASYSKFCFE